MDSRTLSAEAAIALLAARARDGHPVEASAADSRGPETVGDSQSLRFEEGAFVVEEVTWHEVNGWRDWESVSRWARDEAGLVDLLRRHRPVLKCLLRASGCLRPSLEVAPSGSGEALPLEGILQRLEAGQHWFVVTAMPGVREEAIVCRPRLGWRFVETDYASEIGVESAVLRVEVPRGSETLDARARAAALIAETLARLHDAAHATPLPAGLERQIASIETRWEAAVAQLDDGSWWLEAGQAAGLVAGRGITVDHHDGALTRLLSQSRDALQERLLRAIVVGDAIAFGAPPAPVRMQAGTWLDPTALAAQLRERDVVVEAYQPSWRSHDSRRPTPGETAVWAASGGEPSPTLRPTAAEELPEALRVAAFWTANRQNASASAARRSIARQRSALATEALAFVSDGHVLVDARDQTQGTEGVRDERELRRRDSRYLFIRRTTRTRADHTREVDELRVVGNEMSVRPYLEGDDEWAQRALRASRPGRP